MSAIPLPILVENGQAVEITLRVFGGEEALVSPDNLR